MIFLMSEDTILSVKAHWWIVLIITFLFLFVYLSVLAAVVLVLHRLSLVAAAGLLVCGVRASYQFLAVC